MDRIDALLIKHNETMIQLYEQFKAIELENELLRVALAKQEGGLPGILTEQAS